VTLRGQVALVTGGGRGIGRAIALALAREGAAVGVVARTQREIDETVRLVREAGGAAFAAQADVAAVDDVDRSFRAVEASLGPIGLLVQSAGIVARGRLDETDPATWDAVLATNLRGAFLCCRAVLPGMRARGRGRIVNVSSISGRLGTARLGAYCASKWGLVGLTRALAEEVRADGIQVNVVCPGSVDTAMLRQGLPDARPDMTPQDVARVVRFLCADAPDAMTGAVVDVWG
jgi:NAD(P)-dependent dehydrogenase (short-subunit alcohol dehydrogenase family)